MTQKMTQKEWDCLLVICFYHHPGAAMWRLVRNRGGDLEDLQGLKRIPEVRHLNASVTRFISGHLPKLGEVLWETDAKHMDKIVEVLQRSRIDTVKHDKSKAAVHES